MPTPLRLGDHNMKKLLLLGLPLFALTACGAPTEEELAADLWEQIDGWESWDAAEGWPALSISDDGTHGDLSLIHI